MNTKDLLHITQDQYNSLLFDTYFKWCCQKARSQPDLQQLLANARMYKWFMTQITGMEGEFYEEAIPYYELKDSEAMIKLWKKSTAKIYLYYSVPLLNTARRTTIINQIQRHDLN